MTTKASLVLADGTTFDGVSIGATGSRVGEAVFTTGMTGYQEVLTDPSFCGQIVTMTAPQIGNTGCNAEDDEAAKPALAGFVVRELSSLTSSWRATEDLDAYLRRHDVVGISGIDTRALTRHIRDVGAQMAAIGTAPPETLLERARTAPPMSGLDLTGRVTTDAPYETTTGSGAWSLRAAGGESRWHVVAYDFGVKQNILRCLVDRGCRVTVVPARTSASEVLALSPDGIFLSNGPGDPAATTYAIDTVRALLGERPVEPLVALRQD
jgi:carbamoyl-phosphate synthase small subunit